MWVRTHDDELVNLDHIEYVLVEEDDEGLAFELRAYETGWESEGEGEFYTLASATTDAGAAVAMDRLFEALQRGDGTIDFRDAPSAQWSQGFPNGSSS